MGQGCLFRMAGTTGLEPAASAVTGSTVDVHRQPPLPGNGLRVYTSDGSMAGFGCLEALHYCVGTPQSRKSLAEHKWL